MIGGIEKSSLNDFPGKISCVLFIHGCNFYCPYCHNLQSIYKNKLKFNIKKILSFILKRKKYLDGIVISGGEPTLNKNLIKICTIIKEIGYNLKLDTNGSKPEILKILLKRNLLEYVSMDLKTYITKKYYSQLTTETNIIKAIKKSIKIIMKKAPKYEFRTTCVNPFINEDTIREISALIKGADKYILQAFNKNNRNILNEKFFFKKNPIIYQKQISNFIKIAQKKVKYCNSNNI